MWQSETFPTIAALVAALNRRGLAAADCKVVAADDGRGGDMFHLLFVEDGRPLVGVAVGDADAEADAMGNGIAGAGTDDVLDEAEAIIADAQQGG